MTVRDTICEAISAKRLIRFWYPGSRPSYRTVEPHLLGVDEAGDDVTLSAFQVEGGSGNAWRDFHVSKITQLTVLEQTFSAPRQGYNARDTTMSRIICRI